MCGPSLTRMTEPRQIDIHLAQFAEAQLAVLRRIERSVDTIKTTLILFAVLTVLGGVLAVVIVKNG